MLPLHELPGAGPDRVFAEVGADGVGENRRHGHGQQLREDRERLVERDYDGGVVGRLDAQRGTLAVGEGAGAADGVQRPDRPAFRGRVEHASERLRHVSGDQRCAVVEADVAAQVERVAQAVGGDVPRAGDRWLHLAAGGELGEPVEQIRHGAPARHVGGFGRIERTRIVPIARVDQRVTVGGRLAAAAAGQHGDAQREQREERTRRANRWHVRLTEGRSHVSFNAIERATSRPSPLRARSTLGRASGRRPGSIL